MSASPQDRKAHHLFAPCPIPAPTFFLPVAHVDIHSAPVVYDQDSAICAITSKRLETPSLASCRNSPVLMRMLPPHTSVSTRRASGGAAWSKRSRPPRRGAVHARR